MAKPDLSPQELAEWMAEDLEVIYWRGSFWRPGDAPARWRKQEDLEVGKWLDGMKLRIDDKTLIRIASKTTRWLRTAIDRLKFKALLATAVEPPCTVWGDPLPGLPLPSGMLIVNSGPVSDWGVTSFLEMSQSLRESKKKIGGEPLFVPDVLNLDWSVEPTGEAIDFLVEAAEEVSQVRIVLRWLGAALAVGTPIQEDQEKALWLIGSAGSGKSTFFEVCKHIFASWFTPMSFHQVADNRFAGYQCVGKRVVCFSDEQNIRGGVVNGVTAFLRKVISQEPILVERKYADAFDYTFRGLVGIASNELPTSFVDSAGALGRRFSFVRFSRSADVEMDSGLLAKLTSPSSIAGLCRAALEEQQAHFGKPWCEGVQTFQEELKRNCNVYSFLEDCTETGNLTIPAVKLYAAYRQYCDKSGNHSASKNAFGRRLREHRPGVNYNNNARAYEGLDLTIEGGE